MNAQDLKNSILQLAIQGKLVEQREEEGTAKELLKKIETEKKQLIKEGKLKKQKNFPAIKENEIPFDIPESWEWVRLCDIGEIVGGGTPKTGNSEFWNDGDIPWLTPADMKFVQGKYVKNGERYITEQGLKGSSARLMPKGTIIYSSRAPIGYIAIAENVLATNQGFKSLVPYELRINEYMYYCLISRTNEIVSRASGTTFKEISGSEFGLTVVPLPPLGEQKRIVAKIEELIPYIDKYGEAYSEVEKLNKKFPEDMEKSVLQYAIQGKLVEQREEDGTAEDLYKQIQQEKKKQIKEGKIKNTKALPEITEDEIPFDIPENWKWVRLGDVSKNIHYGYTASAQDRGNCKLLRITDIQNNSVEWGSVPFCNVKDKDFETYGLNNRDIMIARTGGTIGKTYIVDSLNDRAVFASYLIRVIPVENINESFLKKYMESPLYWMQLKAGSMGTGQPNVNGTTLSKLLLPLPPLEEQRRIVHELDKIIPYTSQLDK